MDCAREGLGVAEGMRKRLGVPAATVETELLAEDPAEAFPAPRAKGAPGESGLTEALEAVRGRCKDRLASTARWCSSSHPTLSPRPHEMRLCQLPSLWGASRLERR